MPSAYYLTEDLTSAVDADLIGLWVRVTQNGESDIRFSDYLVSGTDLRSAHYWHGKMTLGKWSPWSN